MTGPQSHYRAPGPLTRLDGVPQAALHTAASDPVALCWPVHSLVVQPGDARQLGLSTERLASNNVRPAAALLQEVLAHDARPLDQERTPADRGGRPVSAFRRPGLRAAAAPRGAGRIPPRSGQMNESSHRSP